MKNQFKNVIYADLNDINKGKGISSTKLKTNFYKSFLNIDFYRICGIN